MGERQSHGGSPDHQEHVSSTLCLFVLHEEGEDNRSLVLLFAFFKEIIVICFEMLH